MAGRRRLLSTGSSGGLSRSASAPSSTRSSSGSRRTGTQVTLRRGSSLSGSGSKKPESCAESVGQPTADSDSDGVGPPNPGVVSRSSAAAVRASKVDRSKTLLASAVDATTAARYRNRVAAFVGWLALLTSLPGEAQLALFVASPDSLDDKLVEYFQYLFINQRPAGWAMDLLSGLCHRFPRLNGSLKCAVRAARSWGHLEPSEFRTPWPVVLLHALVAWAFGRGYYGLGISWLLMFHCLLRPREASRLTFATVVPPSRLAGLVRRLGIVVILSPKTRRRAASRQHVTIEDHLLLDLLEVFCVPSVADCLFPAYELQARLLRVALGQLGLPSDLVTLGGARAGGATFHWLTHENIGVLQRRGRWGSCRVLEHYVQEAAVALVLVGLSQQNLAVLERRAAGLRGLLERFVDAKA